MYYEPTPSVGFGEAGRRFFRNLTNFSGRARRSEYWWAGLYLALISMGISAVMFLIGYVLGYTLNEDGVAIAGIVGAIVGGIWGIYTWIGSLSLCIRRLHDTGRSGWWYLLVLIPFGALVLFIMYLGDSGPDNQWGPNPKMARPASYDMPQPAPCNAPPQQGYNIADSEPTTIQATPEQIARLNTPVAAPSVPKGVLRIESGPMAGQVFRFDEGALVSIGRDPARCNLVLQGYRLVSGAHCRLLFRGGKLNIVDTGSTNGTFVNKTRQAPGQPVAVSCPALIQLGDAQCSIQAWME